MDFAHIYFLVVLVLQNCETISNTKQRIYFWRAVDIHVENEYAFKWSCYCGHLEVVKWLQKIGIELNSLIGIHDNIEMIFQWSCKNGYAHYAIGMILILILFLILI